MTFKSAVYRSAGVALDEFIRKARTANPFGPVIWTSVRWPVSPKGRQAKGNRNHTLWLNANFVAKSTPSNAVPFAEPFSSFVKAVICYREGRGGGLATNDHMVAVRALRYLYAALRPRSTSPTELIAADFDTALNHCGMREEDSSLYRVGAKLEEIAQIVDLHRITAARLEWTNSAPRNPDCGGLLQGRIGEEFDLACARKLPSADVLDAIAEISNRVDLTDRDLLCQRATELLFCGGFRPCELVTMIRDCWVEEPQWKNGEPVLDQQGAQVIRCGLRYVPAKEAHTISQIKWIPTVLVEIARRAVQDIVRITEPFHRIACFMAENPGRTLLPEPWHSMPNDALLKMAACEKLLGLSSNGGKSGRQFCKGGKHKLEILKQNGVEVVSKAELERVLVKRSGSQTVFYSGQAEHKVHQCLFVIGVNFYHSSKATLPGTATLLTEAQLRDCMVGRPGAPSIFERLAYLDSSGKPLRVTAYQFRHLLNTLAVQGGMSEQERARWMGRSNVSENKAYDHMSGRELAKSCRERMERGEAQGPIPTTVMRMKDPVRREEFLSSMVATAHVTDLGMCIHDWSALPCPKHGNCSPCSEHLIEKGNLEQKERAQALMQETKVLLDMDAAEEKEGTYGVNNWLAAHRATYFSLKKIVAIHEDPDIPLGTIVHVGEYRKHEDELSEN